MLTRNVVAAPLIDALIGTAARGARPGPAADGGDG